MTRLALRGIGSRPFFWPMHEQPVFRKLGMFSDINLPHAERIARRGFICPVGWPFPNRKSVDAPLQ